MFKLQFICNLIGRKKGCFGPDEKEDIEEARKIAQKLDIPYHVIDCQKEYEEIVLKYFKSEYLKGSTPNPCIRCNSLIKFGVLPRIAKNSGIEFDKFATGHYARIEKENDRYVIKRGLAHNKDQSYFLYRLTQEQLKDIILPLGNYTKDEIREIAKRHGLEVAQKPDSQDFYGGDYNELLDVKEKEGNIVDTKGNILGVHKGIWNYTIGQRKGLKISASEPLYVLSLNKERNEVVVGFLDETFKKSLIAGDLNYVSYPDTEDEFRAFAKFRSTQMPQKVTVRKINRDKIEIIFDEYQKSIALGQSAVVYDSEERVILGGIIESTK